jgi:drug/metabolite transporter (DMT)-like permease
MPLLDVSNATPKQRVEILKYASEIRKFEIERFWQRSLFFWGFIGASFVAYGTLYSQKQELLPLLIACFGLLCSVAWTLQNRGSKYWQEAWEQKVQTVECDVLGARLFSNWEPVQKKGIWGAARFSVSKLAIGLSDFAVLVWITLLVKSFPDHSWGRPPSNWAILFIVVTAGFIVAFLLCGRSSPKRSHSNVDSSSQKSEGEH